MAAEKRYTVAEGTQVHHGGKLFAAGETLTAPEPEAAEWMLLGYVTESTSKAKASKAKASIKT